MRSLLSFLVGIGFLLAGSSAVTAQQEPVAVQEPATPKLIKLASVGAYNAQVIESRGHFFSIEYLAVAGEMSQTNIRSSVSLIEKETGAVSYYYLVPEMFSLQKEESLARTIQISVPDYYSGEYKILLELSTDAGVPLASVFLQNPISLNGSGEYVAFAECLVRLTGETQLHLAQAGVDVKPEEALEAVCSAENKGKKAILAYPEIREHFRSPFGEEVAKYKGDTISFAPGESKEVVIAIPKNTLPQAYTQRVVLKDATTGRTVSEETQWRYVLRGESATVQNIVLNKPQYQVGEDAVVTVGWTGSADGFADSRGGEATPVSGTVRVSLMSDGVLCAPEAQESLSGQQGSQYTHREVTFRIERECLNPEVKVTAVNSSGETLDERVASATQQQNATKMLSEDSEKEEGAGAGVLSSQPAWFMGGMFLLCIVLLALAVLYHKTRSRISIFIGMLVVGSSLLTVPNNVDAGTYKYGTVWGPTTTTQQESYYVTVNYDKTVYLPGETVTVSSQIRAMTCWNGWLAYEGSLSAVPYSGASSINMSVWRKTDYPEGSRSACVTVDDPNHVQRCATGVTTKTFTAPTTPGTYTTTYTLAMIEGPVGAQFAATATFSETFTVVAEPTAELTVNASGTDYVGDGTPSGTGVSVQEDVPLNFSWSSTDATVCSLTGFGINETSLASSGSRTGYESGFAKVKGTYELICSRVESGVTLKSPAKRVNLAVYCDSTPWSSWSACSSTCDNTVAQTRSRIPGGTSATSCQIETETNPTICNSQPCQPTGFQEVEP